jgi:hypothetical protein
MDEGWSLRRRRGHFVSLMALHPFTLLACLSPSTPDSTRSPPLTGLLNPHIPPPIPTPRPTTLAGPPRRSHNQISDDGSRALAAALQGLQALQKLYLK